MLQRLKMLSLFQNSVIERLLGYFPFSLCLFIVQRQLAWRNEPSQLQPDASRSRASHPCRFPRFPRSQGIETFFMNPDPVWSSVNWIHLSHVEPLSVQRLGVRYRLHPLVVEDLVYRENREKMDKYNTHMLITVPFIQYRKEEELARRPSSGSLGSEDDWVSLRSDLPFGLFVRSIAECRAVIRCAPARRKDWCSARCRSRTTRRPPSLRTVATRICAIS